MRLSASIGLSGPAGNGGAEAGRVADAFREADERRREELDRLVKFPGTTARAERRAPRECPSCGSTGNHRSGCPDSPRGRIRQAFLDAATCPRCKHPQSLHRGIVCQGTCQDGGRCRCDTGGRG